MKEMKLPILQNVQISPDHCFQNIRYNVAFAVFEELLFAKVRIHLHNLCQDLGQLGSCEKAAENVLHFVCHQTSTSNLKNKSNVIDSEKSRAFLRSIFLE